MAIRHQAITLTNAGLLSIGPLGTYFSEILVKNWTFSFKKMRLSMSSTKWPGEMTSAWVCRVFAEKTLLPQSGDWSVEIEWYSVYGHVMMTSSYTYTHAYIYANIRAHTYIIFQYFNPRCRVRLALGPKHGAIWVSTRTKPKCRNKGELWGYVEKDYDKDTVNKSLYKKNLKIIYMND